MRIISWNVNGLRAAHKKGFLQWLLSSSANIVGLQEVRSPLDKLPTELVKVDGWHTHFVAAQRPGYSGVGLYSRQAPDSICTELGVAEFDAEGRVQLSQFGRLTIANVYFPNGQGKNGDNSRIPFKLSFYQKLFDLLEEKKNRGERILVMGDLNTAHQEIDLARPKDNVNTSGFCANEREELDRWLRSGWVDTFRQFEKGPGHYSWWSVRTGARARNIGWRIDYVLASPAAMEFVQSAFILHDVEGSDHCPVGVDVDERILLS